MRERTLVAIGVVAASLSALALTVPAPASESAVPAGVEVVTVASSGGRPLLGAVRDGKPILLVDGAEVPLTSSGGYAEGSRWQSIAVDGVRVAAVSGERGGAHGNVRWTVWTGTTAGVKDEPQPFETFGGWGMGQLVAVTYVSGRPLVIGSWQSDTAGFDIAVWRREDPSSWQRAAKDPVMSSTRSALVQPAAATGFGDRLVIVGQTNDLLKNRVEATVWVRDDDTWSRYVLPSIADATADSVSCDTNGCLIGGHTQDVAAGWSLGWDGTVVRQTLPTVHVNPDTQVIACRGRASVLVAAESARTILLTDASGTWQLTAPHPPPAGLPIAATTIPDGLALVTRDGERSRLWTVRA